MSTSDEETFKDLRTSCVDVLLDAAVIVGSSTCEEIITSILEQAMQRYAQADEHTQVIFLLKKNFFLKIVP